MMRDSKPEKGDRMTATGKGTPGGNAGHDSKGRFTKGNKCARGRRVTELRRALLAAVTPDDMAEIAARLVEMAKGGDLSAAALLFDRVLGKPMTTQETELYTHEYDRPDFNPDPLAGFDMATPLDQIRPLDM